MISLQNLKDVLQGVTNKIMAKVDDKQDTIPTYTLAEYETIKNDIPVGALFNIKDDKTQVTNAGTNKYSTDEIICGEWINGKPIYRKVICFNSVNPNPNTFTLNTNINNIDQGIKICGYAEKNGTIPVQFIQTGFYSIEGNLIYCFCVRLSQNGSAQVQLTWGNHTTDTSFNIKLIAEYTKTTD